MKILRYLLIFAAIAIVPTVVGVAIARPRWLPAWALFNRQDNLSEDAGLYCKEHGVPEKFCTICHEELADSLMLCKEHGNIPEDICTLCHPEVAKKYQIQMCKEHGLPEHFCVKCGNGPSASLNLPDDGWCATHNMPEELCTKCAQEEDTGKQSPAEKVCRAPLSNVRLASARLARRIGLQTAAAVEEEHAHRLIANAETAYDANHYADISPRVSGYIREVRADLGRSVRRGDVLAVVDSAEVSAAKTQYLSAQATVELARVNVERTKSLARTGAVAGKAELEALTELNQARASLMDAEQKLRNLGFDDDELHRIVETQDTRNLLEIVAPIDGTVVARHAVQGEAVQPTARLFAVADTSRMWLWIDVYESDIAGLEPGQSVRFSVMGGIARSGPSADGRITWIGSEVDEQTRTTRVRAELENPDRRLRSNQFGEAAIRVGEAHTAIVVPKDAVQRKDGVDLVFLPEGNGVYRPQRVLTRTTDRAGVVEVTWGLQSGQEVVSQGAFLLKTEIMKGAIGAGCCE